MDEYAKFSKDWVRVQGAGWNKIGGRHGVLYRHGIVTHVWMWRKLVVVADNQEEAERQFEQRVGELPPQIKPSEWDKHGDGMVITKSGHRGNLYRHRSDPSMWRWRGTIFRANTSGDAIEYLMLHYVPNDTRKRKSKKSK